MIKYRTHTVRRCVLKVTYARCLSYAQTTQDTFIYPDISAARIVHVAGFMQRSGVRSSVCLSVCPVDRQQQRRAAGLLLSAVACSRCRSTAGTRRTRSAANAGSVMSRAEEQGSTQTYVLSCYLPVQFYTRSSTNNAMRTPDARVDFCWRDVLSWERNKTKVVVSRRLI